MTQSERVLVTGAGGYIGRHVVDALVARGQEVTAVVRPGSDAAINSEARVVEFDLLAPSADFSVLLEPAPTAVVHLAWEAGFAHNAPVHMRKLSDHFRFLEAATEAGVQRLAVLGSMHEIGFYEGVVTAETPTNPLSLYGIAKDALRKSSALAFGDRVALQWLRAYYIFGDDRNNKSIFTKLLEAAAEGKTEFPFTSGAARFDFIHVAELGRQIAAVASQDEVTGIINVGSGTSVSLGEQVEQFIRDNELGISLQYGAFPDRPYDSREIYGDATVIHELMAKSDAAVQGADHR
ncbi:MAG: NAD-dependent epimerase/dehydratase family protein [Pseudoclavibacter sp.]